MTNRMKIAALVAAFEAALAPASAQVPAAIAETEATIVAIYHAEGAQIYECSLDDEHKLVWTFREPIATLMSEGSTVGRHYAGPTWDLADGSAITGKVVSSAPGRTDADIAWLKLRVTGHRGTGKLAQVDTVQRINTTGGMLAGPCDDAGQLQGIPYTADYAFLRKD